MPRALVEIGFNSEKAIVALTGLLKENHSAMGINVGINAAGAGRDWREGEKRGAGPDELLKDKSSWTRLNAALALRKIAPETVLPQQRLKNCSAIPMPTFVRTRRRTRSGKEEQRKR